MILDPSTATWRKSTRSQTNGGCVEAADLHGRVAVRDSKDPAGPALLLDADSWRSFVDAVRLTGL